MGTHKFGYTYRHLCSYCACLESNTPSPPLQIVAGLDNGSVYRCVLHHFSISHTRLTLRVRWIDGTSILDRRGLWIN